MTGRLQALRRAWAFGRHIPPGKLARRLHLMARHRLRDRLGPATAPQPKARFASRLPLPLFPARKASTVRAIGDGLSFHFLGREVVFRDGRVEWLAVGPNSANQLWRMNLHYMEYLEAVDDVLFTRLVADWIKHNGTIRPGAWRDAWNAYALSIRTVVWLQQLALRHSRLAPELVASIEESALRQLAYLERNLETDIGGNHLVKNIKALLWAGAAFEGAAPARWQALGVQLLERELAKQILPDGVHYERSPAYHAQVFADLLECRAVLPSVLPELNETLDRMAQATADLSHPDGLPAQFNDTGLNMAYAPGSCLAVHAALGGTRPTPQSHFAYPSAGYFGYRDEQLTLIADCGPIAPDELPAHGHGDVLSFELSVEGNRVIVDQGVYEYVAGPKREKSRAAMSHNTLWIDGVDQADFFGAFRCGRRPNVEVKTWQENTAGIVLEGAHDGYTGSRGAPIHYRRLEVGRTGLVIHDRVEAACDIPAKAGFLLHPDVTVERIGVGAYLLRCLKGEPVKFESSAPLAVEPAVWWPDMGQEVPTSRLVAAISSARAGSETRLSFAASG